MRSLVRIAFVACALPAFAQDPQPGYWTEDNLQGGFTQARKTGKPVLIVFRCPP